jgi:endonuclease/exonuclease/phosphatase family metal-dependent hydrolase
VLNLGETLPIINSLDGPVLLVGDLNQPPDTPVMRTFAGSGWTDAWATLCQGKSGFTFENGRLERRIDYGWANAELASHLASIEVVGQFSSRGRVDISDHLGLSIHLDLRPG